MHDIFILPQIVIISNKIKIVWSSSHIFQRMEASRKIFIALYCSQKIIGDLDHPKEPLYPDITVGYSNTHDRELVHVVGMWE